VEWLEGSGFDDGLAGPAVSAAIFRCEQVCATPTGPCYQAADSPPHVAFLTALSVYDRGTRQITVVGDAIADIERVPAEETTVPDGAVA
jgi:hypothetical protein